MTEPVIFSISGFNPWQIPYCIFNRHQLSFAIYLTFQLQFIVNFCNSGIFFTEGFFVTDKNQSFSILRNPKIRTVQDISMWIFIDFVERWYDAIWLLQR